MAREKPPRPASVHVGAMPEAVTDLPSLELTLLGAPTVLVGGEPATAEVLWRKHLALLIYLALQPGRRALRRHLQALLWPEAGDEHARRSLNEAIRRLRLALGRPRLTGEGDAVRLATDGLTCDLDAELAVALEAGRTPELLDGVVLDDAPPFEEWLAALRARVEATLVTRQLALGEIALTAGRLGEAAARGRALLARDPGMEPAARLAMRALALAGDSAGALQLYRSVESALASYGERVPTSLADLAERIRTGLDRWVPASARQGAPLVGRTVLHQRTFAVLEQALGGQGSVLVVTGAAGMGKSRLLAAVLDRGALAGAAIVTAESSADESGVRWAAHRALLRGGLLHLPGAVAAPPAAFALATDPGAELTAGELGDAVGRTLGSASEERPVIIALEDVEGADEATIAALHAAWRRLGTSRALLLLTCERPGPDTPRALLDLLNDVGRRLAGAVVELLPFTPDELNELSSNLATWCAESDRPRLQRRLWHETEGDPLLALTLLQGLAEVASLRPGLLVWPPPNETLESPLPMRLPPSLLTLLLVRAATLEPKDRYLLGAAGVLGARIGPDRLARAAKVEPEAMEAALMRLERAHLLVFDQGGFRFPAPLLAAAAATLLSTSERRLLMLAAT